MHDAVQGLYGVMVMGRLELLVRTTEGSLPVPDASPGRSFGEGMGVHVGAEMGCLAGAVPSVDVPVAPLCTCYSGPHM